MYFTIITMITVGYGDIAPVNSVEKIYTIFMNLLSCGTFAYAISCIGQIFSEQALNESEFKFNKKN